MWSARPATAPSSRNARCNTTGAVAADRMVRCERSEWYESASEARCRARRATPRWTAWILATLWSRFRRRQMRRRARPMSRAAKRCMPDRPAARPWAACRAFKTASAARTPSRMSSQNATCSRSAPRFLSRNSSSTASARASWLSVRSRLNQGTLPRGAACRAHFFCSSATTRARPRHEAVEGRRDAVPRRLRGVPPQFRRGHAEPRAHEPPARRVP